MQSPVVKVLKRARRFGGQTKAFTHNQVATMVYLLVGSDSESLQDYESRSLDSLLLILDQAIGNAVRRTRVPFGFFDEHNNVGCQVLYQVGILTSLSYQLGSIVQNFARGQPRHSNTVLEADGTQHGTVETEDGSTHIWRASSLLCGRSKLVVVSTPKDVLLEEHYNGKSHLFS
jgi:hypothetical protein